MNVGVGETVELLGAEALTEGHGVGQGLGGGQGEGLRA